MQANEWTGELPDRARSVFPEVGILFKSYVGQNFIEVPAFAAADVLLYLRDGEQFDMLTDLTAVDHPNDGERFEIVYMLYSFEQNARVRVKTRTAAEVPTVTGIWAAANWLEREAFDMFGIHFAGHPDLKRILMPDDWKGFPLRKEIGITEMDQNWVQRHLGIESGQ